MARKSFSEKLESLFIAYQDMLSPTSGADSGTIEKARDALYAHIQKNLTPARIEKSAFREADPVIPKSDIRAVVRVIRHESDCGDHRTFYELGMPMLQALSDAGYPFAMSELAHALAWAGPDTPPKYMKRSKARLLFEKLTKCGDQVYAGFAHFCLACLYCDSESQEFRDIAIEHAEKSANLFQSPYGQLLLGQWHYEGLHVAHNPKLALRYLESGYNAVVLNAEYGNDLRNDLAFQYGRALSTAGNTPSDKRKGRLLIIDAAEQSHQDAIQWLIRADGGVQGPDDFAQNGDRDSSIQTEDGAKEINPLEPFAGRGKKKLIEKAAEKIKNKKQLEKLLEPLHAMIGCAPVKREIESLIFLAYTNALRIKKGMDTPALSLHAAFLGAPGTGKTTVARMYSTLLHELGYLTKGHMVEVSRADLVGEYIGQTTPRVRQKVEEAIGGVLFIDEAYSLVQDYSNDFGYEVIAELLQQMENRRENLVVVFAGYTDEMNVFLKTNPGLKSRVPNVITFPDYTATEMVRIFKKMCVENHYNPTEELLEKLLTSLKGLDKETVRRMGNARGIRNIFEESLTHQARRLFHSGKTSKKALSTLEAEDLSFPDGVPKRHLHLIQKDEGRE